MNRVQLHDDDLDDETLDVLEELLEDGIHVVLERGPNGTVFIVEPHSNLDLGRCVPHGTVWMSLAYPVGDGPEPWVYDPTLAKAIEDVVTRCGEVVQGPRGPLLEHPPFPNLKAIAS
jgi:hypothetical protein